MIIKKEDRDCGCCEYYDITTGYCRKCDTFGHYHYNVCDGWRKVHYLVEKRKPKTEKAYKKISLFEVE